MKYLITGGCGFLGSNIAAELLMQGADLTIFDSLYRYGSSINLDWLREQGQFKFIHGDIRNVNDVEQTIKLIKPDVIFHLAGQVAMTTSIADPRLDFDVNAGGSFNLLNAVRMYSPNSTIVYSSTNKVYGDLEQFTYEETDLRYKCLEMPNGFDEFINLDFHSPYGASKGSADQYMLDFSRMYGLKTVVLRHSSMFGGRQFATEDQGWVGWFIKKGIEIRQKNKIDFTVSGNGKQVRDLLFSDDCVSLYLNAASKIEKINGQAFNIGGGIENSCSILELFQFIEEKLEIEMRYKKIDRRESDQKVFVADIEKIKKQIDWKPKVNKIEGLEKMLDWAKSI